MKNFFTAWVWVLLALVVCLPVHAQAEESAGKHFLRGLVRKGAQAVQNKLDGQNNAEQQAAQAEEAVAPGVRLPSPSGLTRALREVVMESLEAVKEQYKEEGRVYARQLGDSLAERIVQNPRVQNTLFMVKALAWVVLLYLTVISLLLLLSLRKLHASNKRLLELLEERLPKQGH